MFEYRVIFYFLRINYILLNFILFTSESEPIKFDRPVPENVKLIQGFGFYKIDQKKPFNTNNMFLSNLYIYSPDLSADLNTLFIKGFPEGKCYTPNSYRIIFANKPEVAMVFGKIEGVTGAIFTAG